MQLFFDKQDKLFLALMNRIIAKRRSAGEDRALFFANLHPNGIVDLAIPSELRMAGAVLHLLDTLHVSKEEERIQALQALHDEVLVSARTTLRHNTGRVLIQIMKDLVRSHGDENRQLRLAHDFRLAATGKPTMVRRMLRRYHLLEMPEEWNQAVFDHHVHDANTKGRKNATHLIMDAWIKGIRSLTVIYYNYVAPEAARELMSAAEIVGVTIRIGLLFHAPHRGRLIDLIWIPRGFSDAEGFLAFLAEPEVRKLMEEGRKASLWLEANILRMLEHWNTVNRREMAQSLGFLPEPLKPAEFLQFVGTGQTSMLHLAEYIHKCLQDPLHEKAKELCASMDLLTQQQKGKESKEYQALYGHMRLLNDVSPESLLVDLENMARHPAMQAKMQQPLDSSLALVRCINQRIEQEGVPGGSAAICELEAQAGKLLSRKLVAKEHSTTDKVGTALCRSEVADQQQGQGPQPESLPELLTLSPLVLLDWLVNLHSGYRVILNLSGLTPEDVVTLLWDCQGLITHLELFNLKDWQEGKQPHLVEINALQQAINSGSVPLLKQILLEMMQRCREENEEDILPGANVIGVECEIPTLESRLEKLRQILRNIPTFQDFYKASKLFTRIGTDSTSRPGRRFGMGLVIPQTLPARAQRELKNDHSFRLRLPVRVEAVERVLYQDVPVCAWVRFLRGIPGLRHLAMRTEREWITHLEQTRICCEATPAAQQRDEACQQGNVFTLGGMGQSNNNGLPVDEYHPRHDCSQKARKEQHRKDTPLGEYINSVLANTLKVVAGFLPAFAAFHYTQDWWFLAWLGAPLWFAITGLRNIVQAVLGGGGFRRSPLLRWNSYVSWSRLCDSLMFTGFSVVLLEVCVRVFLLESILNINSASQPLMTFSIISLINGVYIASHNYFRGLQREAIIANLFRSVFAIPVSLTYNSIMFGFMVLAEVPHPELLLLPMATLISKCASDTVAGVIEGLADRNSNMRLRRWDYKTKMQQVFSTYARLDLLFPEQGTLELLLKPRRLLAALEAQHATSLRVAIIVNALDLMYFWFFQPRAPEVLAKNIAQMSGGERLAFLRSQWVLAAQKEVSQLFVDGLVGPKFAKALSFYLDTHEAYLKEMEILCLGGQRKAWKDGRDFKSLD